VYPDPNNGGCYLKVSRKPSREQKFFAKTFTKTKKTGFSFQPYLHHIHIICSISENVNDHLTSISKICLRINSHTVMSKNCLSIALC
jgi:hypothetical protein